MAKKNEPEQYSLFDSETDTAEEEDDGGEVLSVSDVTARIKNAVEGDSRLQSVTIFGEVSGIRRNRQSFYKDFLYFKLIDNDAQIDAKMFHGVAALKKIPKDGETVVCSGKISVYEKYGTYSLICDSIMVADAKGDSAKALEELKSKLDREGLFGQHRELPRLPKKIAIVTSSSGAALQDIKKVLKERYPIVEAVVINAVVQGENAPDSIAAGIAKAQNVGADLIIVGRGGGSAEDLACFNSEKVVRAVYASKIPTISAVGHEIDTTLIDYAADKRSLTPTAAAQDAVPDIEVIKKFISDMAESAKNSLLSAIARCEKDLELARKDIVLNSPKARLNMFQDQSKRYIELISQSAVLCVSRNKAVVDALSDTVRNSMRIKLSDIEHEFAFAAKSINDLSPMNVLMRGYSIAEKDGVYIRSAGELSKGDKITLKFGKGSAGAVINEIKE